MTSRFLPFPTLLGLLAFAAGSGALGAPPPSAGTSPVTGPPARPAAALQPMEAPSAVLPPDDPTDSCAVLPELAPDFALEDVNPTSPSFGTVVPRTAEPGHVTLLYWALPSCGHCQADTDDLGALVAAQGAAWDEVSVRVVALDAALDSLPELADGHDLPILVDTATEGLEARYGAERWYIYLLDRAGLPRTIHYSIDFTRESDRLVAEVDALLAEPTP